VRYFYHKNLIKWCFLLPSLGYLISMAIFPLVWSLSLSFTHFLGTIMTEPQWTGFANYRDILFSDRRFWRALWFTVRFVSMAVLLELGIGLSMAYLLRDRFPGRNFLRTLFLIPMACPPIAVAFLWKIILHPDIGIMNTILQTIGFSKVRWTTSVSVAPLTIVMVDVWEWTPFVFLALFAAIQSLPIELYDAAAVDGASSFQVFRYIVVPIITPVIVTVTLIRVIDAFKLFELVFGITSAGPANATESLSYYVYLTGIKWFDLGKGTAMSWIFTLIVLSISLILLSRLRKG